MNCVFELTSSGAMQCKRCGQGIVTGASPKHVRARCAGRGAFDDAGLLDNPIRSASGLPVRFPQTGTQCEHVGDLLSLQLPEIAQSSGLTRCASDIYRVGWIIPIWATGGMTRTIVTLADSIRDSKIRISGISINSDHLFDSVGAEKVAKYAPIYCPRPNCARQPVQLTYTSCVEDSVKQIVDRSDAIILWGFSKIPKWLTELDFKGRKVIIPSHGCCNFTRNLLAELVPFGTHFTAVSKAAAKMFPESVRDQVTVLYNGVDLNRLFPVMRREQIRSSWGFGDEHKLVGYIGRFAPDKCPEAAAHAVAALGGDYRAVYVGEGYKQDAIRKAVHEIAGDRAKILPRVEHIGDIFAGLDCFVLASPSEGHSQALIESWVTETPAVATRVGAVPELEEEFGQLVFSVPISPNPQELAEAVIRALSPEAAPVIARARRMATRLFHPARLIHDLEVFLAGIFS